MVYQSPTQLELTSVSIFMNSHGNIALVLDAGRLRRKLRAVAEIAAAIHGSLECVSLPAEDVVAVLAKAGSVLD